MGTKKLDTMATERFEAASARYVETAKDLGQRPHMGLGFAFQNPLVHKGALLTALTKGNKATSEVHEKARALKKLGGTIYDPEYQKEFAEFLRENPNIAFALGGCDSKIVTLDMAVSQYGDTVRGREDTSLGREFVSTFCARGIAERDPSAYWDRFLHTVTEMRVGFRPCAYGDEFGIGAPAGFFKTRNGINDSISADTALEKISKVSRDIERIRAYVGMDYIDELARHY
jgi:hypothetical protein